MTHSVSDRVFLIQAMLLTVNVAHFNNRDLPQHSCLACNGLFVPASRLTGVQVQLGHWQQALQQQSSQDRSSAARHRRLTDAVEKEQFMQWNRNACNGCASLPISHGNDVVSAEDDACNVLNIKSGLPLADIRCRLTHQSVEMCRLLVLCFLFKGMV